MSKSCDLSRQCQLPQVNQLHVAIAADLMSPAINKWRWSHLQITLPNLECPMHLYAVCDAYSQTTNVAIFKTAIDTQN